jgi:response regulator of citrate/malate metabolism
MTLTLLVVDDSELIRSRLLGMLDGIPGLGSVHTAATLAQTLDCVCNVQPHLVLLDLYLPDGHALRLVPVLLALAPTLQIAILTADADADAGACSRSRSLQAGAHWFFDKATEFPAAVELVRNVAANRLAAATTLPSNF